MKPEHFLVRVCHSDRIIVRRSNGRSVTRTLKVQQVFSLQRLEWRAYVRRHILQTPPASCDPLNCPLIRRLKLSKSSTDEQHTSFFRRHFAAYRIFKCGIQVATLHSTFIAIGISLRPLKGNVWTQPSLLKRRANNGCV